MERDPRTRPLYDIQPKDVLTAQACAEISGGSPRGDLLNEVRASEYGDSLELDELGFGWGRAPIIAMNLHDYV